MSSRGARPDKPCDSAVIGPTGNRHEADFTASGEGDLHRLSTGPSQFAQTVMKR
jgi:hypothetical protein